MVENIYKELHAKYTEHPKLDIKILLLNWVLMLNVIILLRYIKTLGF